MKEIFRFSRSERIASLIILVLTLGVVFILASLRRLQPLPQEQAQVFDSLVLTLLPPEDTLPARREERGGTSRRPPHGQDRKPSFIPVRDPNRMTEAEWRETGLPPRVIRILLHYREKGGRFRTKEDVKKIYGMTDSLYARVAPYLSVADSGRTADTAAFSPPVTNPVDRNGVPQDIFLEINRADSAAFDRLPGISPYLARRIVRYRELLGGFVRKKQLLEVYGLDSVVYEKISRNLQVDTTAIRRIDVNRCSLSVLVRHPYLTRHEGEAVIYYRQHAGSIGDVRLLLEKHVLPEKTYRRVSPYLQTGTEK